MGWTMIPPAYSMIVLGAAFVLVPAAMWPSVPLVVDKERVGTAFGIMTAIQNVGLLAFPWLNGQLRDSTGGYVASQTMFAGLGVAGLIFAFLLLSADRKAGGVLEKPTPHEA
jgi:MFS family permease